MNSRDRKEKVFFWWLPEEESVWEMPVGMLLIMWVFLGVPTVFFSYLQIAGIECGYYALGLLTIYAVLGCVAKVMDTAGRSWEEAIK